MGGFGTIMTLDLATRFGFCIGQPGDKPRVGSRKLKTPDDDAGRALRNLGCWLRDEFTVEIPRLVVYEAPINIGAMIDRDAEDKIRFRSNPATIGLLWQLTGAVEGICGPYGIMCRHVGVQTVRKHFLGVARPQDPKRAVIERCHVLGHLPRDCRDDNAADAAALWDYACAHFARTGPRELVMFGGAA